MKDDYYSLPRRQIQRKIAEMEYYDLVKVIHACRQDRKNLKFEYEKESRNTISRVYYEKLDAFCCVEIARYRAAIMRLEHKLNLYRPEGGRPVDLA